jgi:hypothetical protein
LGGIWSAPLYSCCYISIVILSQEIEKVKGIDKKTTRQNRRVVIIRETKLGDGHSAMLWLNKCETGNKYRRESNAEAKFRRALSFLLSISDILCWRKE